MLISTLVAIVAVQPTEIVFVRHAETVANATGKYNSRTLNAFSARGQIQVSKLTDLLQTESFDAIAVSPSPRALKTIAPYLQRRGLKAEIWPELLECCHQRGAERSKPASPQVRLGPKIEWHFSLDGIFTLRPDGQRYIDAPTYADGKRQVGLSAKRIKDAWSGSGKRVLIVGHSIHGGMLISQLTGGEKVALANAAPVHLEEVKPGVFKTKPADYSILVRGKGLEPSRLVGTTTSR
jgi:broad specificity phosphatase PhoE